LDELGKQEGICPNSMLFDKSKLISNDELQIDKSIGPLNLLFEAKKTRRLLGKTGNAPGRKLRDNSLN